MRCRQVQSELEMIALDGESVEAHGDICDHLKECLDCRAFWARNRKLTALIRSRRSAPPEKLDSELSAWFAVSDAIHAESAGHGRRNVLVALRYATAAALVTAVVASAAMWAILRPFGAGSSPATTEWTGHAPNVSLAWTRPGMPDLSGPGQRFHCVDSGRIYLAQQTEESLSTVCSINPEDGSVLWRSEPMQITGLAAGESRAFALAEEHGRAQVTALDARTGTVLWEQGMEAESREPGLLALLGGGRVALSDGNGLAVFDALTGEEAWSTVTDGPIRAICALPSGDVVTGADDGLRVLDARNGCELRRHATPPGGVRWLKTQALAACSGNVYWLHPGQTGKMELTCMEADTTAALWTQRAPGSAHHVLADAGAAYVRGTTVTAYAPADGSVRWSLDVSGCGPMTLADGAIHLIDATGEGRLLALNSATGDAQWQVPGVLSCQAFELRNGLGYVATHEGDLIAVALPDDPSS